MAVTSPCSSTSFSKGGGHRSSRRRPQRGQAHSSAPASTRPLRTISFFSHTVFTNPGVPGHHPRAISATHRRRAHAVRGRLFGRPVPYSWLTIGDFTARVSPLSAVREGHGLPCRCGAGWPARRSARGRLVVALADRVADAVLGARKWMIVKTDFLLHAARHPARPKPWRLTRQRCAPFSARPRRTPSHRPT